MPLPRQGRVSLNTLVKVPLRGFLEAQTGHCWQKHAMRKLGGVHLQFAISPRKLCGLTARFLIGSRFSFCPLIWHPWGSFEPPPSEFQNLQVHTTVPHLYHFVPKYVCGTFGLLPNFAGSFENVYFCLSQLF